MKLWNFRGLELGRASLQEQDHNPLLADESGLSAKQELAIYAVLTGLVWGLFAMDRGLWQDDVIVLRAVNHLKSVGRAVFFAPTGGVVTRRLSNLPHLVAFYSGSPQLFLQVLYGLVWLANGWLTRSICLLTLPGKRQIAFLAGALAVCATSDSLTNSIVCITYDFTTFYFLGGFLLALRWLRGARWPTLVGVPFLLACSLMTSEGALSSMMLAPAAFLIVEFGRFTRRIVALLLAWLAALVPFFWFFLPALRDPTAYLSNAFVTMTLFEQFRFAVTLVANNFAPWQWLFGRPTLFGPRPPSVIPIWIFVVASVAGTALVLVPILRRWKQPGSRANKASARTLSPWIVAGGALVFAVAANLVFTRVHVADSFYRTHVISRIWASIAVAAATAGVASILGKRARFALLIPAVFVAFGIAGGIERQDFYLSSWRLHRAELRSVVKQVPGLRDGARMVLMTPPHRLFTALAVPYIGMSWFDLVYDDPSMDGCYAFLSSRSRTVCTAEEEGFRFEGADPRLRPNQVGPPGTVVPYSEVVLLAFSPRDNRFHLLDQLPSELMEGHSEWGSEYNPHLLVEDREISSLGSQILYGPDGLAGLLDFPSTDLSASAWKDFSLKVGDFDADGSPDILWRDDANGANTLRFMEGAKVLRSAPVRPVSGTEWELAGVGDLNGDDKADILWRNTATGVNTVWFMDGASVGGWEYFPGPADAERILVGVGDFNGDGKADMLWRNTTTGVNTVRFMDGTSSIGWAQIPGPGDAGWQLAGVGDFNTDGKADMLWRNTTTGVNTVWFMDGTKFTGWEYVQGPATAAWRIEGVGDFDGDGKPDILWRNGDTQDTVVWFLNGTAFVRSEGTLSGPGFMG